MPNWYYFNSHKSEKGNTVVVCSSVAGKDEPEVRKIKLANGKSVECAGKSLFDEKPDWGYMILSKDPGLKRGELALEDVTPDKEGRLD